MKNILTDMDGVLVHGRNPVPGAADFIQKLQDKGIEFLVITNNPIYTPRDLSHRLTTSGLDVLPERIYTSAMATAQFLKSQSPGGTAFVIGESGLTSAIHDAGYIITDQRFRTSVEGVFAAGEIQDEIWRQVATSVGQGTSAAMSAIHWLEENEDHLQQLDETLEPTH